MMYNDFMYGSISKVDVNQGPTFHMQSLSMTVISNEVVGDV